MFLYKIHEILDLSFIQHELLKKYRLYLLLLVPGENGYTCCWCQWAGTNETVEANLYPRGFRLR